MQVPVPITHMPVQSPPRTRLPIDGQKPPVQPPHIPVPKIVDSPTDEAITLDELVAGYEADIYAVNEWLHPYGAPEFASAAEAAHYLRAGKDRHVEIKARLEALKTQANDARRTIIKDPDQQGQRGSKTKLRKLSDLHALACEVLDKMKQPTIEEKWSAAEHKTDEDPVLANLTGVEKEIMSNVRKLSRYMPGPDLFNTYFKIHHNGTLPIYKSNEEIKKVLKMKEAGWDLIYLRLNELLGLTNDARRIINNAYGDAKITGSTAQVLDRSAQLATLIYKLLPTEETTLEAVDVSIQEEAAKILKEGKPIDYVIIIWGRDYVGMRHYGRSLLFSALCSTCDNTMGLNPAADGESGVGKSWAMQAMVNLIHPTFRVVGMVTPKALMYNVTKRGTTIFLDDVGAMPPELAAVIKIGCSNYQQGFDLLTVVNQEGEKKTFPECINWWITGVDVASFDVQLLNRNINIALDEKNPKLKKLHQQEVHKHQRQDTVTGRPAFQITREVQVCREMTRQLLEADPVNVVIPWIDDPDLPDNHPDFRVVAWLGTDNPRNWPILVDMIKVSASIHRYQRQNINGSVLATLEDYDNAIQVFTEVSKEQTTKLNKRDQAILEKLKEMKAYDEPVDIYQLAAAMGKSYDTVYYWLNGNKAKEIKGFFERADNLVTRDELTETEYDTDISTTDMGQEREKTTGSKSKRRVRIRLMSVDDDPLKRTSGVVSINRDRAQAIIDKYIANQGILTAAQPMSITGNVIDDSTDDSQKAV